MSMNVKKALNFMYFHRRRIMVATTFCTGYGYVCKKATNPQVNEIVRMGVAGSLTHVAIEALFHFADTVNVRAKVSDGNDSSLKIVKKIYHKEGFSGFAKGFSAMFYGSFFCGFVYFALYKFFKQYFKDNIQNANMTAVYFMASFVAEFFTLLIYYPYDLIKCRL